MAKKKRGDGHGGGHGWFVTFADLMGLMMSFFVMLVAFSTMDNNKLKIVAGSMRDAFGVQTESRYSGIVESDGLPTREKMKNVAHISPEDSSNTPSPDAQEREHINGAKLKIDREFALASASLRQALQDMPELTEISKHIMFEETQQGLNLEIVDQDGRSMFADGSKVPYDRTRKLIEKLADLATAVDRAQQLREAAYLWANRFSTSPSCRDSFIAEQVLNWSGLPVIHLRPTYFLEWLSYPWQCQSSIGVFPAVDPPGSSRHAGARRRRRRRVGLTFGYCAILGVKVER